MHVAGAIPVTVVAAVFLAGFQLLVKRIAMPDSSPGVPRPRLCRDDFVFWPEWVVAATGGGVTLCGQLSFSGKLVPPDLLVVTFLAFALCCLGLPATVRFWFAASNGKYNDLRGVLITNLAGLLCLGSMVFVGVRFYG